MNTVTLDLEDPRRVVADLTAAIEATGNGQVSQRLRRLRNQIEAQTTPKPAEPYGLGAVVVDDKGERWVRVDHDEYPWRSPDSRDYSEWVVINAVRVLSEGVPA